MNHPTRELSRIKSALYSEPWMIEESGLEKLIAIAESHAAGVLPEAALKFAENEKRGGIWSMDGRVAVVDITGPVFPKSNMMTALSGATSSQAIAGAMDEVMNARPDAMVLRIDSPGGAVIGGFEAADKIAEVRASGIPVIASVEGMAASLAYLFASQSDEIHLSRVSVVGSVSVIYKAQNDERMMRNAGVDMITLRSGDRKQVDNVIAAGNSTTAQMRGMVSRIDLLHSMFVSAIAQGRFNKRKMDAASVATGEVWIGRDAVKAGIADKVMTFTDTMELVKNQ